MKISIIIPSYNSQDFINDCLFSINIQSYKNFEIVLVDNNSSDQTVDIVKKFIFSSEVNIKYIVEKDLGIYDAINKGILRSNGDIICVLNTDDMFYDQSTLNKLIEAFTKIDTLIVYGDLIYVNRRNVNSVVRYWKSNNYKKELFFLGWSPPHPSFFARRECFVKNGLYNNDIGISADIELMYRFLEKKKLNATYINRIFVKMRSGGVSNNTLKSILVQNLQILNFLGIKSNLYKIFIFFLFKFFDRLKQYLRCYI